MMSFMESLIELVEKSIVEIVLATIVGYGFGWLSGIVSHTIFPNLSKMMWERLLPSDYEEILARSVPRVIFSTRKELFSTLSKSPILLDGGTMSFALNKKNGKKCYMLGARRLTITISQGDNTELLKWTSDPDSRFSDVAELPLVNKLKIEGKMETRMLSPRTMYAVYLVFKTAENSSGLSASTKASIKLVWASGVVAEEKFVYLKPVTASRVPTELQGHFPHERNDGWMEIEMGEFFNGQGDDRKLEMKLTENKCLHEKSGLIIHGIELRPKEDNAFGWINTFVWLFIKSRAESATIRERFLLSDYLDVLARADSPVNFSTSSELLHHLRNSSIFLDNGTMCFTLDRQNKKCYMLGARALAIAHIDNTEYWKWTSHPGYRFSEVAELVMVFWLSIVGEIETRMLSPDTTYAIYLVFRIGDDSYGLSDSVKASIKHVGAHRGGAAEKIVFLNPLPTEFQGQFPLIRMDGWMEIEMGVFFNTKGDNCKLKMELTEIEKLHKKSGLIVQGIELRPKESVFPSCY